MNNLISNLERLKDEGYIRCAKHPTLDLTIWTYSALTVAERKWDEYTLMARGLVTNSRGAIIARPLRKFFNLAEVKDSLPNEPFYVTEKLDGSLGIVFKYNGELVFASKGSFTTNQAKFLEQIWNTKYSNIEVVEGCTYLFEMIYPENRIVVNYGSTKDIFLLAVIKTNSGNEITPEHLPEFFPNVVKSYEMTMKELLEYKRENFEGFVLRYLPSNYRVKIKQEEYVALHGIVTQCNTKVIWEALSLNIALEGILEKLPDELYKEVMACIGDFRARYKELYDASLKLANKLKKKSTNRKEYAAEVAKVKETNLKSLLFLQYDGADCNKVLWKLLKPEKAVPIGTFKYDNNSN